MDTVKTSPQWQIEYKSLILLCTLITASFLIAFLVGTYGYTTGISILAILIGIPLLYKSVADSNFGFFVLLVYSYFLALIGRLFLPTRLPMGIGIELLETLILLGILVGGSKNKKINWENFRNPVTYLFLVYQAYNVLQVANPNAVSLAGWITSTRGLVFDLVIYFILVKLYTNLNLIKKFTIAWLFLSLLAALYGIYQEIFGYQDFEWLDIYSTPGAINLIQNWDFLRKFSFLTDVTTFGIVMAYSGLFCAVLALGPFNWKRKVLLVGCSLVMFVSMSFSGTRTATAMVPAGFFLYILMHINNRRTLIILICLVVAFIVLLYGPFYGGTITRLRTTFQPSKDASMNVREVNRARAQPYIQSHPIGGGVNTTDSEGEALSPGHQFAGFPTDSGFLKTAITIGWIGLSILMALYFAVISIGVTNYYKAKDPMIKVLYCGYITVFFSLIIANYAQWAMGQKPVGLLVFSIFVLMPNLIKLEPKKLN